MTFAELRSAVPELLRALGSHAPEQGTNVLPGPSGTIYN